MIDTSDHEVNPTTPEHGESGASSSLRKRRGFAAMDPARQREIASRGGKASHEKGTGHEWDRESAREAGRKGGIASHAGRKREGPPTE